MLLRLGLTDVRALGERVARVTVGVTRFNRFIRASTSQARDARGSEKGAQQNKGRPR